MRRLNVRLVGSWLAVGMTVLMIAGAVRTDAQADDRCVAVARNERGPRSQLVQPAQFRPADPTVLQVRFTYVGHSTFLIETAGGVKIATDYNDYVRPAAIPDIATMNRAHSTHFTIAPDPAIRHVLRGWNPAGGPAIHDVTVGDARVRNLPTNIRVWGSNETDEFGNSIFIFELGNLCVAHLGHLHHTLSERQLGQIGQMDVVLAPVDGSYTLDTPGMIEVLKGLRAPLVLPMHYFSTFTLNRFLDVARSDFEIQTSNEPQIAVSRASLPQRPQVLVLPPSGG